MVTAASMPREASPRGFTLIELLVVLAVVGLLLSIVAPRFFAGIDRSRDAVLRQNLKTTREALDRFYGDLGRYPDAMQELVDRRYLRALPVDPVVDSGDAWVLVPPPDPRERGRIFDLRSAAPGRGSDGTPYADW
jgi:general secretion pathway protein G